MKVLTIGVVMMLFLGVSGTRVEAQGVASSFDQLRVLLKPGDKIRVVDVNGQEADGNIGMLTPDTLTVLTRSGPLRFGQAEVAQIRQRRNDSLVNGAIIGAVAATAYLLTMIAVLPSDGGDVIVSSAIAGTVLFAGMGAAAGAGIDAMIAQRQVIYQRPGSGNRVSLSPLLGRGRRGAAIVVRF